MTQRDEGIKNDYLCENKVLEDEFARLPIMIVCLAAVSVHVGDL